MRFDEKLLGEVLDLYDHLRVPLSSLERDNRQGEFRYFGAQGVIDYIDDFIYEGQFILIAEDGANLVTRNEPIAFLVNGQFWVNNHAHVVKAKEGQANDYYITSLLNHLNIAGFITGAAQPKLSQQNLKQIKVSLPDFRSQCEIADILSSYDNLIENNRRRMALLEESARLLYLEWFVRLRFPGYEHTRIVDGVPVGWQKKALGDSVTLNYGKALKADDRIDGDFPVYGSSGVVGLHHKPLVRGPGIIVGRKGNVGSVFWSAKDFFPIDTVYFITTEQSSLYLFYALQDMHFISTDVAVPGLNRDFAYSRDLLLPSKNIVESFLQIVAPIHDQLNKLEEMNQKLRTARDLLLPRLMSGEIEV